MPNRRCRRQEREAPWLRRSVGVLQVLEARSDEFFAVTDHLSGILGCQVTRHPIVTDNALIERVQEPAMEFLVKKTGLDKVLPKRRVYAAMPLKSQAFGQEERFSNIEHRIVGPAYCKVRVTIAEKSLCSLDSAPPFREQGPGFGIHAGIASSRTFSRKTLAPVAQSSSETNTRLMVTPDWRDSDEMSALVRFTSRL